MLYRKLGRETRIRRSILAGLTKDVINHGYVVTTDARAKEVRKFVDKMITYGKDGSLVSRRKALETTIEDLDFSVRAYNCLKRAGIHTMQDLIDKREVDVTKIRNLGKKSLKEVLDKVKDMGLKFRD